MTPETKNEIFAAVAGFVIGKWAEPAQKLLDAASAEEIAALRADLEGAELNYECAASPTPRAARADAAAACAFYLADGNTAWAMQARAKALEAV